MGPRKRRTSDGQPSAAESLHTPLRGVSLDPFEPSWSIVFVLQLRTHTSDLQATTQGATSPKHTHFSLMPHLAESVMPSQTVTDRPVMPIGSQSQRLRTRQSTDPRAVPGEWASPHLSVQGLLSLHRPKGTITRQPTVSVPIQMASVVRTHRLAEIAQTSTLHATAAITKMTTVTPNVRNTEIRVKSHMLRGRL